MRKWVPGILILIAYALSIAAYPRLPLRVPTHWGLHGPNAWGPRAVGAFLTPTIALGLWLLFVWLPSIDPRRANYQRFRGTYDIIVTAAIAVMVLIHIAVLAADLGWPVRIERVTPIVIGLMFIVIGNVLPRARPNWFFGIRTPWTLSSDVVWERTHRVGGYLMVAAGLLTLASAFLPLLPGVLLMAGSLVSSGIAMVAYSYIVWRRTGGNERRGA